jgi:hypothetical protein
MTNSSSVTSGNRGTIAMLNSSDSTVGFIRFAAVTDNVGTEIQFYTRPAAGSVTQSMTLNSVGGLQTLNTISVGNATPTTSGAGITFPATQSASSNANTLDDYEEGTWTPVLQGSSTSGTYTYDTVRTGGTYTKIGNTVYIRGVIRVTGTTSAGSGDANIANLPFPSAAAHGSWGRLPGSLAVQAGPTLTSSSIFVHTDDAGSSYLGVGIQGTASWTAATVAEVGTTNAIWFFEIQYKV